MDYLEVKVDHPYFCFAFKKQTGTAVFFFEDPWILPPPELSARVEAFEKSLDVTLLAELKAWGGWISVSHPKPKKKYENSFPPELVAELRAALLKAFPGVMIIGDWRTDGWSFHVNWPVKVDK